MSTSAIHDRLAALRVASRGARSEVTSSSSLSLFYSLYIKAEYECVLNYMEGAKLLHEWLTKDQRQLNCADIAITHVPKGTIHSNYALEELLKILCPDYTGASISALLTQRAEMYTYLYNLMIQDSEVTR